MPESDKRLAKPRVLIFETKPMTGGYGDVYSTLGRVGIQTLPFSNQKYALEELTEGVVDALVVLSVRKTRPSQDLQADDPFLLRSSSIEIPRAILSSVPSAGLYTREDQFDTVIERAPRGTLPDRVVGWVTSLGLQAAEA